MHTEKPIVTRALLTAALLLSVQPAFAHIRIVPTDSTNGIRERYTMRVPNEKQVATIRVEGEFPAGVTIYDFEFKPGWKIEDGTKEEFTGPPGSRLPAPVTTLLPDKVSPLSKNP